MDTQTAILLGIGAVAAAQILFVTVAAAARGQNGGAWFLLTLVWTVGIFPAVCVVWASSFTVALLGWIFTPGTERMSDTWNVAAYGGLGVLVLVLFVPILALAATAPRRESVRRKRRIKKEA